MEESAADGWGERPERLLIPRAKGGSGLTDHTVTALYTDGYIPVLNEGPSGFGLGRPWGG